MEKNGREERRKNKRHSIPAMVNCTFFEEVVNGKNSFQGFIQDISFGGVSLEIMDDFFNIKEELLKSTHIAMEIELNFPDEMHRMGFSGIIKWCKKVKKKDKNALCIRIQFHDLDEKNADVLKKYLSSGLGDKNLFWNLWDNLSVQPQTLNDL